MVVVVVCRQKCSHHLVFDTTSKHVGSGPEPIPELEVGEAGNVTIDRTHPTLGGKPRQSGPDIVYLGELDLSFFFLDDGVAAGT